MKLSSAATLFSLILAGQSAYAADTTTANASASKTHKSKVLIIGAGASGIAAAKALAAKGITDYIVIEGRKDVIGGRMHNINWPPGTNGTVELGANWVEGVNGPTINPITELANKYNLVRTPTNWDDISVRDARGAVAEKVWGPIAEKFDAMYEEAAEMAAQRVQDGLQDMSLRAAYRMLGWNPTTPVEMAIEWNGFDAEQAERPDVSSHAYTADMHSFGPDYEFVVDKRGFKTIIEQEANAIGLGYGSQRLHLGKVVNSIQWAKDTGSSKATTNVSPTPQVTVKTKDGTTYVADYVISSTSLGVLQSPDIKFTPALPPWKIQSIFEFNIATYTKIFLNFPKKFWSDTEFTLYADSKRGYFGYWQNTKAKPYKKFFPDNSNIFFVTVTDLEAKRIEQQSDEATLDEIMVVLRKTYGPNTPRATHIHVPRWHSDPLFRGTFTNWPIGQVRQEFENLRAPVGNLWFTGEHTSLKYFGYVHGAWLAGLDIGGSVAQCIKGKCPSMPIHTTVKEDCGSSLKKRGFDVGERS
ncbi:hypothetical protein DFJ77DRAFT_499844 [Powellomyces hirtus]|nr:hypothetical protein DFJ77DRAFT_499844 [Powellomyces hirtus]